MPMPMPMLMPWRGCPVSWYKDFTERYEIVYHQPNTASGFSGTVFRDKKDPDGKLIVAFRGTEFSELGLKDEDCKKDVLEDIQLAAGLSEISAQTADMNEFLIAAGAINSDDSVPPAGANYWGTHRKGITRTPIVRLCG
jgi:hypothetical protein